MFLVWRPERVTSVTDGLNYFSVSLKNYIKFSSASYRKRRCQPVAAAFGPHWAPGWGPPSSQSPGWFPLADTGWPGYPSSWGNSHRSEGMRWPLETLCLCWLHLNYVNGWTCYPWHLDNRKGVITKTREWGNVMCEMKRVRGSNRTSSHKLENYRCYGHKIHLDKTQLTHVRSMFSHHTLHLIHSFFRRRPVHQKAFWHWEALAQITSKDPFFLMVPKMHVFAVKFDNNILNVKTMCKICP